MTMPAEPPQSPIAEAVRSLEVRWIFPGPLQAAVAGWFGRFPAATEAREDLYLLEPPLHGLSVKVRGGGALEVKAYRGSAGFLEVAGRARGRLASWEKWSFPSPPLRHDRGGPPGWQPVRKRRRISRFTLASGPVVAPAEELGGEPRCDVELTEVRASGQPDWRRPMLSCRMRWLIGPAVGFGSIGERRQGALSGVTQSSRMTRQEGPRRETGSWTGAPDSPSMVSAISAITRAIDALPRAPRVGLPRLTELLSARRKIKI